MELKGTDIAAAWKKWKESPDAKNCFNEPVSNPYLSNRLERAFLAGVECAVTLLKERAK